MEDSLCIMEVRQRSCSSLLGTMGEFVSPFSCHVKLGFKRSLKFSRILYADGRRGTGQQLEVPYGEYRSDQIRRV
jgi:hypothetical protein